MNSSHGDELLTVDDVATLLKVSKSWVYEHTRRRGISSRDCLPSIKLGKYVRFSRTGIEKFLQRRMSSIDHPARPLARMTGELPHGEPARER